MYAVSKIRLQQFLGKLDRIKIASFAYFNSLPHQLSLTTRRTTCIVCHFWLTIGRHSRFFSVRAFSSFVRPFSYSQRKGRLEPWIRIVVGQHLSEVVGNKTLTMESLIFFASYSIEGKPPHNKGRTVFEWHSSRGKRRRSLSYLLQKWVVYSLWEDMNNSMFCSWKIGRETESLGNYLVHHEAEKRLNTKKVFFLEILVLLH